MNIKSKRRILLAVSGMSPQIITETLYALVTRKENPWVPDEIHVLSTQEGIDRVKYELLHPSRNMFGKFCSEYLPEGHSIKFDDSSMSIFRNNETILKDIRNLDDSAAVADSILKIVAELTADVNSEIHASIAGGRKSMGFLLGYAISLYGRPQDKLSHVLVNEDFENCHDFYFPPRDPIIIHNRDGKPLDTSKAEILLAEIPVYFLRDKLPKKVFNKEISFSKVVKVMNRSFDEPSIVINPTKKILKCHGIKISLSNINFSFYYFVAKKTLSQGSIDLMNIDVNDFISIKEFGVKEINLESLRELSRNQYNNEEKFIQFFVDRRNEIKEALDKELGLLGTKNYSIKTEKTKNYIEVSNIRIDE